MVWPELLPQLPPHGDILIELQRGHSHGVETFTGPEVVVFARGVHNGGAGQEGLQVQPEMALGRGFTMAWLGNLDRESTKT